MTNKNAIALAKRLVSHKNFPLLALELKKRIRIKSPTVEGGDKLIFNLGKREAVDDFIEDLMLIATEEEQQPESVDGDFAIDQTIHKV